MTLLGYIIMAHPDWRKSHLKIFCISSESQGEETKRSLEEWINAGRLPITFANIEIVSLSESRTISQAVEEHSKRAGLTIIGFREEIIKHDAIRFFTDFNNIGDVLFVNASQSKIIT